MSQKIKILIADDINKIAEDNKNIVSQNENVEIVGIASNGQEEMEMILEFTPDLVITDNKMPIINGIEGGIITPRPPATATIDVTKSRS